MELFLALCLSLAPAARAADPGAMSDPAELVAKFKAARPSLPAKALAVPLHQQETNYSCGAAALFSVLRYWQAFDGKERDLYSPLGTTRKDGTEPPKLAQVAKTFGLSAELRKGMTLSDLRAALDQGQTVIVDIQAWREGKTAKTAWKDDWEDGHYVVLVGLDDKNAFFEDPVLKDSYAYMPVEELPVRWHDYEDRHGRTQRYWQAGIVIHGKTPAPAPLPAKKPARLD
ncbi:MAG: C39 family peptidase [Elusimicrobia bacterium]|nr:C39 family peptidase [Elusimicrobiota bacterium]